MVLQTDAPASSVDEELAWETVELRRNAATVLPNEYKLGQVSPEHPATTYQMFKRDSKRSQSCVCMPYNVAAADSSGYNYASGRLDHQVYDRALRVNQSGSNSTYWTGFWAIGCLNRHFWACCRQQWPRTCCAQRYGTAGVAMRVPHSWEWDKRPHVDPGKEATAQRTRLQSGTTSRAHEMKESGLNMDEIDAQAAVSFGYVTDDGLPDIAAYRKALGASLFSNGNAVPAKELEPETEPEPDEQGPTMGRAKRKKRIDKPIRFDAGRLEIKAAEGENKSPALHTSVQRRAVAFVQLSASGGYRRRRGSTRGRGHNTNLAESRRQAASRSRQADCRVIPCGWKEQSVKHPTTPGESWKPAATATRGKPALADV